MPTTTDNLYDFLVQHTADMPDKNTFNKSLQDKGKREALHKFMSQNFADVPDFTSFDTTLGPRDMTFTENAGRVVGEVIQTVQDIPKLAEQGWTQGQIDTEINRAVPDAEKVASMMDKQKTAVPTKTQLRGQQPNKSIIPSGFIENPVSWLTETMVTSMTTMLPQVLERAPENISAGIVSGAMIGAAMGTPTLGTGSAPLAIAGGITGAGAAVPITIAQASKVQAQSELLLSELKNTYNVDVNNHDELVKALSDTNLINKIKSKVAVAAETQGFFDGLSATFGGSIARMASKHIGKRIAGKVVGEVGEFAFQAASGMAGEAGKQVVMSGKVTDPQAVVAEGLAEMPTVGIPARVAKKAIQKVGEALKFTSNTGDVSHFNRLEPDFKSRLQQMAIEYKAKTGKDLQINSAARSVEEQKKIYDSGVRPAAKPGKSRHNSGTAVDVGAQNVKDLSESGLLEKYGFESGAAFGDPNHIQNSGKTVDQQALDMLPDDLKAQYEETAAVVALEPVAEPTPMEKLQNEFVDAPKVEVSQGQPEVVQVVADVIVKEPWQMTKKDFDSSHVYSGVVHPSLTSNYASDLPNMAASFAEEKQAIGAPSPMQNSEGVVRVYAKESAKYLTQNEYTLQEKATPVAELSAKDVREGIHRKLIQKAISEGKPVPAEVLADYPELQAQQNLGRPGAATKQIIEYSTPKLLNSDKKPLTVYHATEADFETFKEGHAQGWGAGVYFSTDIKDTEEFGNKVIAAHIEDGKFVDGSKIGELESAIRTTKTWKAEEDRVSKSGYYDDDVELDFDSYLQDDIDVINSALRELGYDGIITKESNGMKGSEVVIFDPKKIIIQKKGSQQEIIKSEQAQQNLGRPGASTYSPNQQQGELYGEWRDSSFGTTISDSEVISEETKRKLGATGAYYYRQISHVQTQEQAKAFIVGKDPMQIADMVMDANAEMTPTIRQYLGMMTVKRLDAIARFLRMKGDIEKADMYEDKSAEVGAFVIRNFTEFGRAVESAKMFDPDSPAKVVDNFEKDVEEQRKPHKPAVREVVNKLNKINDEAADEIAKSPKVQNTIRGMIRAELEGLDVKLAELIREHFSVIDNTGKTLQQKIVEKLALTGDDALALSKKIEAEFARMVSEKKASAIRSLAKKRRSIKRVTKGMIEKLIELSNLGALDENTVFNAIAEKLKLPQNTEAVRLSLRRLATSIQDASLVKGEFGYTVDYWVKRKALQDFILSLSPSHKLKVFTGTVMRGVMLMSIKSPITNIIGNTVLATSESLSRRILEQSLNGVNGDFSLRYFKYVNEVFDKSGYDPTRMIALADDQKRLGEEMLNSQGKGAIRKAGRFVEDFVFKQMLGKPDVAFSAAHFVDSANINSTKIARKLGGTQEEIKAQALLIYRDAIQIEPMTPEGMAVRNKAITDATRATYTDTTVASRLALGMRNLINSATGDLRVGDQIVPFAKTPANVVYRTLEASGVMLPVDAYVLYKGMKTGDEAMVRDAMRGMILSGLGFTAAMLFAGMVDPDDYMDEYFAMSKSERALLRSISGAYSAVKIGDNWVSLDYFGPYGSAITGILSVRKYGDGKNLQDQAFIYYKTAAGQVTRVPGVNEIYNIIDGIRESVRNRGDDLASLSKDFASGLVDFLVPRVIPSILGDIAASLDTVERQREYDTPKGLAQSALQKIPVARQSLPERIDMFGQPIESQPWWGSLLFGARYKKQRESEAFMELQRLNAGNELPSIADVRTTSSRVKKLKEKIGQEDFDMAISKFGSYFKSDVDAMLQTTEYQNADDEVKKDMWNKVRGNALNKMLSDYGEIKKSRRMRVLKPPR